MILRSLIVICTLNIMLMLNFCINRDNKKDTTQNHETSSINKIQNKTNLIHENFKIKLPPKKHNEYDLNDLEVEKSKNIDN